MQSIGWDGQIETGFTFIALSSREKNKMSRLLKKDSKSSVLFMLAMSVSITFQISESHFLVNKVEKVKGGRS